MAANHLYKAILDTTHALIVVLDAEGRIVLFNKACGRLSGYRFDEVEGRPVRDFLMLPEEAAGVMAVCENLRAGQFPNQHKNHWVTKTGELRLIEWSNSAVTDESGCVIQIIGTGIDITERERSDKALRETQQRQRALLDSIPDAAWLKDSAGRYVEGNQKWLARHNLERAAIIGKTDLEIFAEQAARKIISEDRQIMNSKRPFHTERNSLSRGDTVWLDVSKTPVLDEHGNVIGIAGVSRDITERRLADQARQKRDAELRAALVREVNHRIKNNLQSVMALLHMHMVSHPETALVIQKAVARLNAIATVHGMHSGAAEQDINVRNIVHELAGSMRGLHSGTPIVVQTSDDFVAVQVMNSETVPVALIINELIQNAFKHSPAADDPGQPIRIDLARRGPGIRIAIFNPGAALPAAFDYSRGAGLGTGLQLIKSLMPRTGAALRFETTDAGVTVTLDLAPPILAATDKPHAGREIPHG